MSESTNESSLNLLENMHNFETGAQAEREHRLENAKNMLHFGISFLDEALGGIYRNDLILLGANSKAQ